MKNSIEKLFDLSDKVAIVTGGAMGIGKGIALKLADAGATVLIADIVTEKEAEETLAEIKKRGAVASYLQVDISKVINLPMVIDKAIQEFGDLDILVNNAGIYGYSSVTELSEEIWDKTMDLNLKAVAFLSKLAVNEMLSKKHGGKIINISSIDGIKPSGNLAQYDSSKGGVRMLTKAFAKEVGRYGIQVNDIAPGAIDTPGVKNVAGKGATKEEEEAASEQIASLIKTLPVSRMGMPEDIGNAALFLASDASSYITGSTVVVDGGFLVV